MKMAEQLAKTMVAIFGVLVLGMASTAQQISKELGDVEREVKDLFEETTWLELLFSPYATVILLFLMLCFMIWLFLKQQSAMMKERDFQRREAEAVIREWKRIAAIVKKNKLTKTEDE